MPSVLDRSGQRFGRLLVLSEAGRDNQSRATWLCRCDCGTEKVIPSRHLGSGAIASCGCQQGSMAAANGIRGGIKLRGANSPLYKEQVGYTAAHQRIRTLKGLASEYACVDCNSRALHWSYDHLDENQFINTEGLAYSIDPSHYEPRCVRCHWAHDHSSESQDGA
jgi:hypothetical protein